MSEPGWTKDDSLICLASLVSEMHRQIGRLETDLESAMAVARQLLLVDFDMFTEHDEMLLEDTVKMAQATVAKAQTKAPS